MAVDITKMTPPTLPLNGNMIVLDTRDKLKTIEIGDRIYSPTKVSSFIVTKVSGCEFIVKNAKSGKIGVRTFAEIERNTSKGYYHLEKQPIILISSKDKVSEHKPNQFKEAWRKQIRDVTNSMKIPILNGDLYWNELQKQN